MSRPTSESITCYIRCRPLNQNDLELGAKCVSVSNDNKVLSIKSEEKEFAFDNIFTETTSQEDLYNIVGYPMIKYFLEGYNSTILVYGQTGSGKTHTMLGPIDCLFDTYTSNSNNNSSNNNNKQGLIPNILNFLIDKPNEVLSLITKSCPSEDHQHHPMKTSYTLSCSCLEIYQEHIIDLLCNEFNEEKLTIREHPKEGMFIEGLTELPINSLSSAKEALMIGLKNRHVASTNLNSESSRSHFIFTLFLETSIEMEDGLVITRNSRLHLVDLAGSERQKSTCARGERIREAGMINKSLSSLGNVINAVIELNEGKTKHIPFRDSKLTYYLKDSIGGNSKTVIIGNISQSFVHLNETLSTLMFIQRAKMIKNKVQIIENVNDTIKYLKRENMKLSKQNQELQMKINEYETQLNTLVNEKENNIQNEKNVLFRKKSSFNEMNSSSSNNASVLPSEIKLLLDKINSLFLFEDKINEQFRFLDKNIISLVENFLIERDNFEIAFKTTLDSINDIYISNNIKDDEEKTIPDKLTIFNLTLQIKKTQTELQTYKTIVNFLIKQSNIDESKKSFSKEILQQFIDTNKELKVFFTKNIQKDSQYILIQKEFIDKLNLQLEQMKSNEEQNTKLIETLQSENFLLNMEINKYEEEEKYNYNTKRNGVNASESEFFASNLRNSLRRSLSNNITFNPFANNNNISSSPFKSEQVVKLQNEIKQLTKDKQHLLLYREQCRKKLKDINNDINDIINNIDTNNSLLMSYYISIEDEFNLVLSKYIDIHNTQIDFLRNVFKIFNPKEKNQNYQTALELMINIQETLELHQMYFNSKAFQNEPSNEKNLTIRNQIIQKNNKQ